MSLSFGRDLVAIPGPSVIPDRVLSAMHRASPNIYEGEIVDLTLSILADLARLAETSGDAVMYICNGHGAWEAAIANTLAPGDTALVLATGRFGLGWAEMAQAMGVEVEVMDFGFREAADPARLEERLAADKEHRIRAVLTVQTDTASSVTNDIPALRHAIDAANHPALFMVDAIACFGCEPMRMDDWGVDVMVAGCQKGLMTPPGLAFNFVGPRGYDRRRPTPKPLLGLGTADQAGALLPAVLRHAPDASPLRPSRSSGHDRGGRHSEHASAPPPSGECDLGCR